MIVTFKPNTLRPNPMSLAGGQAEGIRLLSSYLGVPTELDAADPVLTEDETDATSPFGFDIFSAVDDDDEDEELDDDEEEEEDDDFDFDDDEDDDFDDDEEEEDDFEEDEDEEE
ncbi:MAG: hypothetical protein ACFCVE_11630 [Phycisphaerae bacterium]